MARARRLFFTLRPSVYWTFWRKLRLLASLYTLAQRVCPPQRTTKTSASLPLMSWRTTSSIKPSSTSGSNLFGVFISASSRCSGARLRCGPQRFYAIRDAALAAEKTGSGKEVAKKTGGVVETPPARRRDSKGGGGETPQMNSTTINGAMQYKVASGT